MVTCVVLSLFGTGCSCKGLASCPVHYLPGHKEERKKAKEKKTKSHTFESARISEKLSAITDVDEKREVVNGLLKEAQQSK